MAYTKPQILDTSPSGDKVKAAIVNKLDVNADQIVADLNTHEALTATHGATGAIVGTTNTQTLTNKTLTNCIMPQVTNAWVTTTAFKGTPASTSTLTMTSDLTASILVGMSLEYTIGGTAYYGQVSAITSNLLTVRGAPLSGDVTELRYGGGIVRELTILIPGLYEDASNTALILSDLGFPFYWELQKSYCVFYQVYSRLKDTSSNGKASVRINNTELNTSAGGLTIATAATLFKTTVDIDVAAYDINFGEVLEITCVKGTTGDAEDLSVTMIFITP